MAVQTIVTNCYHGQLLSLHIKGTTTVEPAAWKHGIPPYCMPLELPHICSTEQRIESPTQETPEGKRCQKKRCLPEERKKRLRVGSCRCWSKTKDVQEATTRKEGTFTSHNLLQHRGKPQVTENVEKESSCQVETLGVSFKYC